MNKYPQTTSGDMVSLRTFVAICENQNVTLAPDFIEPVLVHQPTTGESHEPLPMLAAVAEAGRLLRKMPHTELGSQPIRNTKPFARDVGAATLAGMVNGSLEPVIPNSEVFSINCPPMLDIAACPYTEIGFASTINTLHHPDMLSIFSGCDIILDSHERPLFIRKADGVASALALQPFVVNGIPYPAGSIARVETIDDYTDEFGVTMPVVTGGGIDIFTTDRITGVAFKRLSAYALPSGERSQFGRSFFESGTTTKYRRTIRWETIKTISELAADACEIDKQLQISEKYIAQPID